MPHPSNSNTRQNVIASSGNYINYTLARLGIDRALPVLNRAVAIWDDIGEPELAEALRRDIQIAVAALQKLHANAA